jgi:hypothetical protein
MREEIVKHINYFWLPLKKYAMKSWYGRTLKMQSFVAVINAPNLFQSRTEVFSM